MSVLGLAAGCADSTAVLVADGRILGAVQEERFTRIKHDASFPDHAIGWCRSLGAVERIALHVPQGRPPEMERLGLPVEHVPASLAHAASALLPSPFDDAAVLVLGMAGEGVATWGGQGPAPVFALNHSLGDVYAEVTRFLGFRPGSGELKVMGLAPYGRPRFVGALCEALLDLQADGGYALRCAPAEMGAQIEAALGLVPRAPETALEEAYADVAASLQCVLEQAVLGLVRRLAGRSPNLCLAGGLALNCAANRHIAASGLFDRLWVQPAAGNAGAALGAAMLVDGGRRPPQDAMRAALLGPSPGDVEAELRASGARFDSLPLEQLVERTAAELAEGRIVGWVRGPMEFGPRALGGRSILADPRKAVMQRLLNEVVKYREPFRPFAPAVPVDQAGDWFALSGASPYMLLTAEVLPAARSVIPAVTHVDGSARVQTVSVADNPDFHALLTAFGHRTGCPVLVNTSFNIRGEPIVRTASDAFRCFMGGDIDSLVVGSCFLRKEDQDPSLRRDYRDSFARD